MAAAAGGGAARALSQKEQDIQMMLAADVQLGTKNCDFQMERYVFKRRTDGTRLREQIPTPRPSSAYATIWMWTARH
jgi:ribosomal protein S2